MTWTCKHCGERFKTRHAGMKHIAEAHYHCGAPHDLNPEWRCNREAGHPGEHCRQQIRAGSTEYENIWWPNKSVTVAAPAAGDA